MMWSTFLGSHSVTTRIFFRLEKITVPRLRMQLVPLPIVRGKKSQSKSSSKWLDRQRKDPYVKMAQEQHLPSRASFKLQEINEDHFPSLGSSKGRKTKRLIQPGMLVLDLGAAPGGWSLYASTQLNPTLRGALIAVDMLPLDETLQSNSTDISFRITSNLGSNFKFIQGDFTSSMIRNEIVDALVHMSMGDAAKRTGSVENPLNNDEAGRRPDLILSDMAPNFTGDSQTDAIRTINLCEQALAFAAGEDCFDSSYSTKAGQGLLADGGVFLCKYFSCGKENEADLMEASRRAFRSVHKIKPKASRKASSEMYLLAVGCNCK
ncbi:hypothetical protein ACHAWF_007482 [Thalassiosira exigua]